MLTFPVKSRFLVLFVIWLYSPGVVFVVGLPAVALVGIFFSILDTIYNRHGDYNTLDLIPLGLAVLGVFFLLGMLIAAIPIRRWLRDPFRITLDDHGLVKFRQCFGNMSMPAAAIRSVSWTDKASGDDDKANIRFEYEGGGIDCSVFPAGLLLEALRNFNPKIASSLRLRKTGLQCYSRSTNPNSWSDYLRPGERILWEGAPARLRWRKQAMPALFLGTFLGGLSVFVTLSPPPDLDGIDQIINQAMILFFSIYFMSVGLCLIVFCLMWPPFILSRTRYALTTQRALAEATLWNRILLSIAIGPDTKPLLSSGQPKALSFNNGLSGTQNFMFGLKLDGFEFVRDGDAAYEIACDIASGKYAE